MKKAIIIAIIAIIVIGSGAIIYYQVTKGDDNTQNNGTNDNDDDDDDGNNNGGNNNGGNNNGSSDNDDDDDNDNDGNNNGGTNNGGNNNGNNNGGNNNGGNGGSTSPTGQTSLSCNSGSFMNLDSDTLKYCISSDGTLNVKTKADQITTETANLPANAALLTDAGAKITYSEKIGNIAYFNYGQDEPIGFLGLSVMVTESGKGYLISNDDLYNKAQVTIYSELDLTDRIVSITSPDKTVKCSGSVACGLSTTVKTSTGKSYIIYANGAAVQK